MYIIFGCCKRAAPLPLTKKILHSVISKCLIYSGPFSALTLVFLGGGYRPANGFSPIAPKHKTKGPRASKQFLLHPFSVILMKTWGYGKPSEFEGTGVGGWLPPENILSRHFEKYLHDMDLTLTEHVRNTISLLYK